MENMNDTECLISVPVLRVSPNETMTVGERLLDGDYTLESLPEVVRNLSQSAAYYLANYTQDESDVKQEKIHKQDSFSLLIIVFLLFLIIITIWVFHARRIRILHSTGLALLYGEWGRCEGGVVCEGVRQRRYDNCAPGSIAEVRLCP